MPIPYEILREGRMALFTYPRAFEVADITAMVVVYQQDTLDKATKKIYSITDLSAVTRFPTNILSSSMGLIKNSHPMAGPTFLVTPNAFINKLATILSKAFPSGLLLVRNTVAEALEEADRLIAAEIDQT